MNTFIRELTERNYQKRKLAFIENGSWAPMAAKYMTKLFIDSKDIELAGTVTIKGAVTDENKAQLTELAEKFK